MNEQTRATSTAAAATAVEHTAVATAADPPEDAWDRLAALAFGGAASAGGCSAHAHDYDCACPPGHGGLWYPAYPDPESETIDG